MFIGDAAEQVVNLWGLFVRIAEDRLLIGFDLCDLVVDDLVVPLEPQSVFFYKSVKLPLQEQIRKLPFQIKDAEILLKLFLKLFYFLLVHFSVLNDRVLILYFLNQTFAFLLLIFENIGFDQLHHHGSVTHGFISRERCRDCAYLVGVSRVLLEIFKLLEIWDFVIAMLTDHNRRSFLWRLVELLKVLFQFLGDVLLDNGFEVYLRRLFYFAVVFFRDLD